MISEQSIAVFLDNGKTLSAFNLLREIPVLSKRLLITLKLYDMALYTLFSMIHYQARRSNLVLDSLHPSQPGRGLYIHIVTTTNTVSLNKGEMGFVRCINGPPAR